MIDKELLFRLNRAKGQIDALKKKLESEKEEDCVEVLRQLKSSINALKKFGEAYMLYNLDQCIKAKKDSNDMNEQLREVISTAFSL
jgi:DNA-binding FrmR family transcriptional regulator